jgi:hypothetical protein
MTWQFALTGLLSGLKLRDAPAVDVLVPVTVLGALVVLASVALRGRSAPSGT